MRLLGDEAEPERQAGRPRVFVSYACEEDDGQRHTDQVRELCRVLRDAGIEARWDGPAAETPQDWARWRQQECEAADFVVVIASPAYRRYVEDRQVARAGMGVPIEATHLQREVDENRTWYERILRVVLAEGSVEDFPDFLGGKTVTRYAVDTLTVSGCEELLRYLHKAPWELAPTVGSKPALPPRGCADEPSGGLDRQAWQELAPILCDLPTSRWEWSDQAFRWSFGPPGSAEAAAAPFPEDDLDLYAWARALADFHHRPGSIPKVVAFAHALAAGFAAGEDPGDRKIGRELISWVRQVALRHRLPELPAPPELAPAHTVITMRLDQDPQDIDHFYAQVWIRARGWRRLEPKDDASGPRRVTLDEARELLEECLRELSAPGVSGTGRRPPRLRRIEFAVPDTLLEVGFDQWRLKPGPHVQCLGKRYEVVLRCPDARSHGDAAYQWSSRWTWLTRQGGAHHRATVWLDSEDLARAEDLMYEWCEAQYPVCVAVSATPAGQGWRAALEAGVPVILWQRDGPAASSPPVQLRDVLPVNDVTLLPRMVKKLRMKGDPAVAASVVLLWDDPDHALDSQTLTDAHLTA
ncbi:hypothetical protein [Streptomyces sp. NPDC002889]|uniref:VMAP-C domain-containing protein n=1 Tax=Streptomyces sp. NPDC002889 TaxID=3364669 RepID=UPI0036C79764